MPYSRNFPRCFYNILRLSTRWSRAYPFRFVLTCYSVVDVFSLCCRADRFLLRTHLLQTSAPRMLFVNRKRLRPVFHHISPSNVEETEDVFFYFFDSGGEVDIWRFFSRLPIRTIRNPIVKLFVVVFFFFYHWVALITLISLGNYRLRKKPMNECSVFHCVLWLHTNNFLGFSFFFVLVFFCNGCR